MYNRENEEILSWGDSVLNKDSYGSTGSELYLENFQSELYQIYLKSKADPSTKNALSLLALGKCLKLIVDETKEGAGKKYEQQGNNENRRLTGNRIHFIFVVPSDWEYDIRDEIIRPLFIAADLIGKNDDPKMVLFFTEIDSLLQQFQSARLMHALRFTTGRQFGYKKDLKIGFPYLKLTVISTKLLYISVCSLPG